MLGLAWIAETLHLIPQNFNTTITPTLSPIPAQGTPAFSGGTASPGTSTIIGHVSDVPVNSATSFTIPSNSDPGVLIHLNNGQFVAFDAACTHAGCPVDYDPGTQHLICPCHGAEFDPAHAAAVLSGPTNIPLTSVPIHVNNAGGTITLGS
jgi:thiosulfate dehydrogenase [quinone] large subunit